MDIDPIQQRPIVAPLTLMGWGRDHPTPSPRHDQNVKRSAN
jgi:hypothetical protein